MNLVRTSDEVLWRKLVEVGTRLAEADEITLDGAGRITTTKDGVTAAIDAAPEQAAVYAATEGAVPAPPPEGDGRPGGGQPGGLMDTGTIPHWTAPPAVPLVPPTPDPQYPLGNPAFIQQGTPTDGFDNWMLAASAVGTAAGKSVPITIDTIAYYNRTAAKDGLVANWRDVPKRNSVPNAGGLYFTLPSGPEEFVDYSGFSYTRSEVFSGCTTWLDVGTLTWKSGRVLDRVPFIDLVDPAAQLTPGRVGNIAGFAQMADDVRSVINYLHENEVVVDENGIGFYIDPVFEETFVAQAEQVVELNSPTTLSIRR